LKSKISVESQSTKKIVLPHKSGLALLIGCCYQR